MKRRNFINLIAAAGATAAAGRAVAAERLARDGDDDLAVLIDLSLCEGCRNCEYVCAEVNGLPEPDDADLDGNVDRRPTPERFVAVSSCDTQSGDVFVRRQCMHCIEPACAAACLTKALEKTDEGPVVWHEDRCMGCRYCMISCPFDIPQFEYHSAVPKIRKCEMCFSRLAEGERPACVEECPAEALTFGRRGELLEIARSRIYSEPGRYVSQIYGEKEAGGTSILYISPVPFEELGFRMDLGEIAYPEYTRDFLTAVPVVLFLWPAFLLGVRNSRAREVEESESDPRRDGGVS